MSPTSHSDGVTLIQEHEMKELAKVTALRQEFEKKQAEEKKAHEEKKRTVEESERKIATSELQEFSTQTLAQMLQVEEQTRESELTKLAASSKKGKSALVTHLVSLLTNGSSFVNSFLFLLWLSFQ
jgi:FixJ family two-component response regulator